MARSRWKSVISKRELSSSEGGVVASRNSMIFPDDVGHEFSVHNGKKFISVFVKVSMIGTLFGQYVRTRSKQKKR